MQKQLFCYKNALGIIFTIKCIRDDFYYKKFIRNYFTIKIN